MDKALTVPGEAGEVDPRRGHDGSEGGGQAVDRRVTFTLDPLDLSRSLRLQTLSAFRTPRLVLRLSAIWAVGLAALAGFFLLVGMPWRELRDALPVLALILAGTILGVSLGVPLLLGPLAIRRRFRQDKLLCQPVTVSWGEVAYEANQPGVHNRIPWETYMTWREDRHLFVFLISDYNYQVLPKRVLDPAQVRDVRAILSAALGRPGSTGQVRGHGAGVAGP